MPKTERLYYADCYMREFNARVLAVEPEPRGFRVYVDRSAFHPESGGQPTDQGTLDGAAVLEVVDEGDELAHVLSRQPEAATVKGVIDWTRRFDHMQQHTGQHLLSAAFEKIGDYRTISFHMGAETSTIDLRGIIPGSSQPQNTRIHVTFYPLSRPSGDCVRAAHFVNDDGFSFFVIATRQ